MGIYVTKQAWYLWGYCQLREDLRIFRLSRISQLQVHAQTFVCRNRSIHNMDQKRTNDHPRLLKALKSWFMKCNNEYPK
jgi:predicted DNA-binding transcriptional regulator YafY